MPAFTSIALGLAAAATAGSLAATGYQLANQPKPPQAPKPPRLDNPNPDAARNRLRQQAAAAFGRSNTIMTSPLGLPGRGMGTRSTLLGV